MLTIKQKNKHHFFAALGGALMTFAMAPFHVYPLAFISILVFFLLLESAKKNNATYWSTGWFFGLGFWGSGVSWIYVSISEYGYTPKIASPFLFICFVAFIALFHAVQGWTYGKIKTRHKAISFILLWALFEWFRQWFLNGFPWLYAGYAFNNTVLTGYAPVLGIYSLSLIVAATALLPALMHKYPAWIAPPVIFTFWVIGYLLQGVNWTQPKETISVALVQGNISQEQKWEPRHLMGTLNTYQKLSGTHWDADITLWPEAAIPMFYNDMQPFIAKEKHNIIKYNTTLITGIPYDIIDEKKRRIFYNGIISLSPNTSVYKKQKLVPFGEYIPFSKVISQISPFIPIENFQAGSSKQKPLTYRYHKEKYGKIGTFICFETAYPNVVAKLAKQSDMLATVSNDTWFGNSHGPHQHLQMAQMRAIENQKYVIRSTNNGITAIIDNWGNITEQIPQNVSRVLTGEATRHIKETPFSQLGNFPIIVFCFGFLSLLILQYRKSKLEM